MVGSNPISSCPSLFRIRLSPISWVGWFKSSPDLETLLLAFPALLFGDSLEKVCFWLHAHAPHSFQGPFFSGNHQKPRGNSRFLKRTMVEQNGESPPRLTQIFHPLLRAKAARFCQVPPPCAVWQPRWMARPSGPFWCRRLNRNTPVSSF